ncbi:MAG: septum site-determining protein MinC [Caulobacteraceae bacterium]
MAVDRVERRSELRGADIFDLPTVRLRGRNVLALVLAPEFPMSDWFAAFDRQLGAAPGFFADRPIVADLRPVMAEGGPQAIGLVLDTLALRDLKLIGVEGVEARHLAGTPWERLATRLHGREAAVETPDAEAAPSEPVEPEAPAQTSLLIDRPVRSGQSVVFAEGDVTVVGSVSSGAEVLAGGSIHVYGALRGRAIAGLRAGAGARIFCRKLEAELVGVDQLYRTAEHWGPGLHGRAVQVMCDRGALRLSAFD